MVGIMISRLETLHCIEAFRNRIEYLETFIKKIKEDKNIDGKKEILLALNNNLTEAKKILQNLTDKYENNRE